MPHFQSQPYRGWKKSCTIWQMICPIIVQLPIYHFIVSNSCPAWCRISQTIHSLNAHGRLECLTWCQVNAISGDSSDIVKLRVALAWWVAGW